MFIAACGTPADADRARPAKGLSLIDTGVVIQPRPPSAGVTWERFYAVTEVSERPGQHHATVARGANGELGIAWDEFGEPKSSWFRVFDAQGEPLIDPLWLRDCDATGPCRFDVEAFEDGYWLSGSDSQGIWLMALDERGAVLVEPYLLEVAEPGISPEAPDIAVRRDGGLLVAWVRRDLSSDQYAGEYATIWVDASGVPEGVPETLGASPGGLSVPDAVGNVYGGAQVAWFERDKDGVEGALHLTEWFWPDTYGADTIVAQGPTMVEPRVMLDMTDHGTLVASWRATLDEERSSVRVRARDADRVWGPVLEIQVGAAVDKPTVAAAGHTAFVSWDNLGGVDVPVRQLIWWQAIDLRTMTPLGAPAPITDGPASQTRSAMDVRLEDGEPVLSVVWSSKRYPKVARQIKYITGRLQPLGGAASEDVER